MLTTRLRRLFRSRIGISERLYFVALTVNGTTSIMPHMSAKSAEGALTQIGRLHIDHSEDDVMEAALERARKGGWHVRRGRIITFEMR